MKDLKMPTASETWRMLREKMNKFWSEGKDKETYLTMLNSLGVPEDQWGQDLQELLAEDDEENNND
jgi:hypothetical protein